MITDSILKRVGNSLIIEALQLGIKIEELPKLSKVLSTIVDASPEKVHVTPEVFSFSINNAGATKLANNIRQYFRVDSLDPIYSLPNLIEKIAGIPVISLKSQLFNGGWVLLSNGAGVLFVSSNHTDPLTCCAIELCKLLVVVSRHIPQDLASITLSDDTRRKTRRDFFVRRCAYELLLPTAGLGRALKVIRKELSVTNPALGDIEILYLARIYGVSFLNAATHCEVLGLLPRGGANSLHEFLCKNFGSAEIRATELGLPPAPKIIFRTCGLNFKVN